MEFYVGSFGHRYSDPIGTYAGCDRAAVEDALARAVDFEAAELPGYCEMEHPADGPEDDCGLCNPDLVDYGVWYESTPVSSGIVTFGELLAIARECRANPTAVVALARG